eukprot:TRINITY_DN83281_c0_g1_i1.p1 TRINITY_DN83281_c0_g1~~TRINITY_DN83281_c0_g1_i1.p1  ORF type:complete len:520 (+),score=106.97 TRINITY_DN83281_c0_g1_i1:67-1626(+)
MPAEGYQRVEGEPKPAPPKLKAGEPNNPNCFVRIVTSGWTKILVQLWAAYMLTGLSCAWLTVTEYHLRGPDIRQDESFLGESYDYGRTMTKQAISAGAVADQVANSKKGKIKVGMLDDSEFVIVDEEMEMPTGWKATVIHGWMITMVVFYGVLALGTWFIFFKNTGVVVFNIQRWNADQETREKRQAIAADIALLSQLLVPAMTWVLHKITGFENVAISENLYIRMMAMGPMVMIGVKILILTQSTMKDAQAHLNTNAGVTWTVCDSTSKTKIRDVKRASVEMFLQSHFVTMGPLTMQRGIAGAFIASTFETRPFAIILTMLGIVDELIVKKMTMQLLGVIPSWIDEDIMSMEEEIKSIGEDADKLKAKLDDGLRKFKGVFVKARHLMDEALVDMNYVRSTAVKVHALLGSYTKKVTDVVDTVEKAFKLIEADIVKAELKVTETEDLIEKNAKFVMDEVKKVITELIGILELFRPVNILQRVDDLADEAIYGEVCGLMAASKARGALPLTFEPAAQAGP